MTPADFLRPSYTYKEIITLSVIDGLEGRRREDKLRQQETTLTGQAASEALHEQSAKLFWWYAAYTEGTTRPCDPDKITR